MTTRQKRVAQTIQLTQGQDDDLIYFVMAIPKGHRQQALKDMMRLGLRLPARHKPVATDGTTALEKQLASQQQAITLLSESIRQLQEQLSNGVVVTTVPATAAGTVDRIELEKRVSRLKKAGW